MVGPHLLRISTLALCLLGSVTAAVAASQLREKQALWLSQQLHRTIEASQILSSPDSTTFEGCTISNTRLAATGATALSLRCPASRLPHLVLLHLSPAEELPALPASSNTGGPHLPAVGECGIKCTAAKSRNLSPSAPHAASPKIVRAGAALRADWRTAFIHAQLPVVALESGAAGAEIRVRITYTNRIVRARIISADDVAIVQTGA